MENKSFLYGTVIKLAREDSLADIERNFSLMKESGLDTVVVWPASFWWEERREGYPFNTGKAVLEIAERVGLGVIMELAGQLPQMEYIPDFQMKDEYYCVDEYGKKQVKFSSFGPLNYFHPEVDALIKENFKATAEAYKDYPALIAYDVFNETAFNSYDEYTIARFREWLRAKYVTVERLNDVWDRCYTDFSEVTYSPWVWMSIMPAADFGAFRRESVALFLKGWCDAVRSVDPDRPLIADNIGSMVVNGTDYWYERPQDDFSLKGAVDEIGMSFYPKQVKGTQPMEKRWQTFDSFFAASRREGFYISEMQTHIQAMFNPTTAVRPYELKQWCYEALAGGAKGLIYWMWRPFTKGLQTSGRGLVDYKERSTPRLEFANELSKTIADMGATVPVRSKIGILYDPTCLDFSIFYAKSYNVDKNIYLNSICGAYGAMLGAGVRSDIVTLDEIENYKVLILTNHIVIGKEGAAKLEKFVRGGGTVICDGKIGMVDEKSMLSAQLPGGGFNDLMGLEYVDSDYAGLDFSHNGESLSGYYSKEICSVTDGEVLASFGDGNPAIVEKRTGDGAVITFNTYVWYAHGKDGGCSSYAAELLAREYELCDVTVTAPLMARISENEKGKYAFVFNYTDRDASGVLEYCEQKIPVALGAHDCIIVKL